MSEIYIQQLAEYGVINKLEIYEHRVNIVMGRGFPPNIKGLFSFYDKFREFVALVLDVHSSELKTQELNTESNYTQIVICREGFEHDDY